MKIGALSLVLLLVGAAPQPNPWRVWEYGLARACPSRHVELMGDGYYDDFLAAFDRSLRQGDRSRLAQTADLRRRCAHEEVGFSCEMVNTIRAAQQRGLLETMIAFGCRTVKCEEGAMCSRLPRGHL